MTARTVAKKLRAAVVDLVELLDTDPAAYAAFVRALGAQLHHLSMPAYADVALSIPYPTEEN